MNRNIKIVFPFVSLHIFVIIFACISWGGAQSSSVINLPAPNDWDNNQFSFDRRMGSGGYGERMGIGANGEDYDVDVFRNRKFNTFSALNGVFSFLSQPFMFIKGLFYKLLECIRQFLFFRHLNVPFVS